MVTVAPVFPRNARRSKPRISVEDHLRRLFELRAALLQHGDEVFVFRQRAFPGQGLGNVGLGLFGVRFHHHRQGPSGPAIEKMLEQHLVVARHQATILHQVAERRGAIVAATDDR